MRSAACDWRLSRGDLGVFAVLLQHCDQAGACRPGPARISTMANLATSNVKASLGRLEELAYIRVHRPGPRKANRYQVLDSPAIPCRRTAEQLGKVRAELGLPAGLDAVATSEPTRSAGRPHLGPPAGLDTGSESKPTRPAGRSPTRPAGRLQLGLPTGHESTLEGTSESTGAARPLPDQETREQKQARRDREICDAYRDALDDDENLAAMLAATYRRLLEREGLIQAPAGSMP